MGKRWFFYLTALAGCLAFYFFYQEWVSWIFLQAILALPIFSLVLSLPAMLMARAQVQMPPSVPVGKPMALRVVVRSPLPVPMCRMNLKVYHTTTGHGWLLDANSVCPTNHCGALNCRPHRAWVYDYLGMFRLPLRKGGSFRILVRPRPLELPEPDLDNILVTAWRPKPGGGFAENHELREYRPGDHLSQIHWKLTAKTNKLILREPMVPDRNRLILWLTLDGTPAQIDRKLGRLLWMGSYLQRKNLYFQILAYTAQGQILWDVDSMRSLRRAMDQLLCHQPYAGEEILELAEDAAWSYRIGGDEDEKV